MKEDLLFHVISKRKWKDYSGDGYFRIMDEDLIRPIECIGSEQLNKYLNEYFKGRKNLFVLVVVPSRIVNKIDHVEKNGFTYYFVEGGINLDAILDKIRIDCNEDGLFDILVERN